MNDADSVGDLGGRTFDLVHRRFGTFDNLPGPLCVGPGFGDQVTGLDGMVAASGDTGSRVARFGKRSLGYVDPSAASAA